MRPARLRTSLIPTDLKLLGEARAKTEAYLDLLHKPHIGRRAKPRTYRQKARRQFLAIAKQKKPGMKKIRKAIGQQLRFLKGDLGHLTWYLEQEPDCLTRLINIGLIVLNLDTWLRRHLLLDLFSALQGGLLALNQSRKVQTATGRCFCWPLSAKVRI